MLLDISGNTFSSLGSSVPTRLIGPREIYGDSLQVHVDTTDYRNMFSTATGSTNVSPTGKTHVKRIDDISGKGRKFYYFTGTSGIDGSYTINGTSFQETFTSTTLNQFSGSSFDTNKGVFGIDSYGTFGGSNINMLSTLSYTALTAPDSAATVCSYAYWNTPINAALTLGLVRQYYLLNSLIGFSNGNNTNVISFNVKQVTRFTFNATPYLNRTSMFLGTITGNTYYVYVNDTLITSGTMTGTVYPISGNLTNNIGGYFLDSSQALSTNGTLSKTHEGFISHSYTTPEQVKLLYNYFTTKFKNKIGNYR
jgi:hypothetical protein